MTEPTAEQVDAERERAHAVLVESRYMPCMHPDHNTDCDVIATALARVRIEAHAAGRDEFSAALLLACATYVPHETYKAIADAIRALRGRT